MYKRQGLLQALLAVLALERQDSVAGLVRLLDMLRAIEDGLDCGSGVAADQCRLLQEIGGIISDVYKRQE